MRSKVLWLALFVFCILVSAWIYHPAISYPFQFDDLANVVFNRTIRYLWHPRIFLENIVTRARPVTAISYAIDYSWDGLVLWRFHLTNFFLHALSGSLLGYLFFRWFGKNGSIQKFPQAEVATFFVAAVFVALPLAVDSVVYLSARSSLLCLFFLLLALVCHRPNPGIFSYVGFLIFALLAFLSKESAIVLFPLLLLVHRLEKRPAKELAGYLIPLVGGGFIHLALKAKYLDAAAKGFFTIQGSVDVNSFGEYARLSVALWPKIIGLFFSPEKQALDHEIFLPATWLEPSVLAGLALVIAFLGATVAAFRRPRYVYFPFLWFFFSLLATNSIFPVLDPFSERHFYVAIPGLAVLLGFVLLRFPRFLQLLLLVGGVFLLGSFAKERVHLWRSPFSLWGDSYKKYPGKFRVAYNTALAALRETGDFRDPLRILFRYMKAAQPGEIPFQEQEILLQYAAGALKNLSPQERLAFFPAPRERNFWEDLLFLKIQMDVLKESVWLSLWRQSEARHKQSKISPKMRDPDYISHSFSLLLADFWLLQKKPERALPPLEGVILSFDEVHMPFWTKRELLGDLYVAKGEKAKALAQFDKAATQYKVFKQFPLPLHLKIYDLQMEQGDFSRASDSLGELARVFSDSVKVRCLYAKSLEKVAQDNALSHLAECDYFKQHAVPPTDPREMVRP